jgi:S1-C subfamily serine protease
MTPMLSSPPGSRLGALPLLALLLALLAVPMHARQAPLSSVVEARAPAVVHVAVRFVSEPASSGGEEKIVRVERPSSGVVVSSEGLVLTNGHLVSEIELGVSDAGRAESEYWLEVSTRDGRTFPAHVVARDERTDLSLIQVQLPPGETLPAAALGAAEPPPPGARTVTLAYPDGEHTYSFQGAAAHSGGGVQLLDARLATDEVLITDTRSHALLDGGPVFALVGLYNSSHIQGGPEGKEDDDEETRGFQPVVGYVVIVSTSAIRASFPDRIDALQPTLAPPAGTEEEVATAAVATIAPSVVSVWTDVDEEHPTAPSATDPHGQRLDANLGSGVILDPGGLIVTSSDIFHGREPDRVSVRLAGGETYPAEVLEVKRVRQLALLALELPEGVTVPAARISEPDSARSGETIAVVGRPYGPTTTLSVGVLGNLDRGRGYYQVGSWLHRGHWGGAVVDRNGRLIGIAVEKATGEEEFEDQVYFGFAAPVERVLEWFDDEWLEHAPEGTQGATASGDEEELPSRRSPVTDVVDATQSSLVNIAVSKAVEVEESDVFDPFAVEAEDTFELLGQGSGVIIDAGGLALTNWHVIGAAVDGRGEELDGYLVEVTLPDGRAFVARVLSTSRDDDLALLRLEIGDGERLVPVEMADSDELVLGQPVVAIGNALGLSDSVSAGSVSCTSLDIMIQGRLREYEGMLMTDAAINFGNSGGALLDLEGRLVGINSAGRVGAGMAIPVNRAREVFSDKLLSAQKLRSVYLGLEARDEGGRVAAASVHPDGPAQRAGVLEGDVLLSIGGTPVPSAIAWAQLRLQLAAGAPVKLVVEREGSERALEIAPLGYAAWHAVRQSGIEVREISYGADPELVRDASIALHRAYSGISDAEPSSLMTGVLRVVRAHSLDVAADVHAMPGDLLLGLTRLVHDASPPSRELVKLDDLARLNAALDELATRDGRGTEFWILRDGEVHKVTVFVRRAR